MVVAEKLNVDPDVFFVLVKGALSVRGLYVLVFFEPFLRGEIAVPTIEFF